MDASNGAATPTWDIRLQKIVVFVGRLGLAYLFFTQLFWKLPPNNALPISGSTRPIAPVVTAWPDAGSRKAPVSDGHDGLRVVKVLDAAQRSLKLNGEPVTLT